METSRLKSIMFFLISQIWVREKPSQKVHFFLPISSGVMNNP